MENKNEESLAGIFSVDAEKYSLKLLTDLHEANEQFSISTWKTLRGNGVFFASDLLQTSPAQLMKFVGFTDENLSDIQRFAAMLQEDQSALQSSPPNSNDTMDFDEQIPDELQKLKACRICIPFDISFAQRYSIELKSNRNCQIYMVPFPHETRKRMQHAGLFQINDVLMLSPAQLIKNTNISLLELPGIEDCVGEYIRQKYKMEIPVEEISPEGPPLVPEETAPICADVNEALFEEAPRTEPICDAVTSVPVQSDQEERTFSRIYGLRPDLYQEQLITTLNLSVRAANVFRNNAINTVADLLNKTPGQLMQLRNFGQTSLVEVEQLLEEIGKKCACTSEEIGHFDEKETQAHADVPAAKHEKDFSEIYGLETKWFTEVSVYDFGLSVRTANRLKKNQIECVADLLKKSPEQLTNLRGFGKTCLCEIEQLLASLKNSSADTKIKSPLKSKYDLPQGSMNLTPLFPYAHQIADGDFSFADDPMIPPDILPLVDRCREAQFALGSELAKACLDTPAMLRPVISACSAFCDTVRQQNELREILDAVPEARRRNKVHGYINAYTQDERRRAELLEIYHNGEAAVASVVDAELNSEQHHWVSLFLKWCTYDLEAEIEELLRSVYANDRRETVVQMRARKATLEQIGTTLGVTRERVRQIENKAKRIFQSIQGRVKIISKIAADLNSASVVMPGDLVDYCGNRFDEVLFLLRSCESGNYTYDQTLDLFIVGDDSLQDRTAAFIESLPEMFPAKKLKDYLRNAEEEFDLTEEIAQKALSEVYQSTGDVYHRNRLSRPAIYEEVLNEYYPDGIHIHNPTELARFRDLINQKYGNVKLANNDRALAAAIARGCVLCGKGQYRLKQKKYIPRSLEKRIHQYIENSDHSIFMTNTLFFLFEDDLRRHGVDNKYYLQGILHELFGDQYTFTRDYISKDASITSIYSSVVNHIKKSRHPVSKKQLQQAFPGVPEMALNLAVGDPEVLQYLGEYLHASRLSISERDKTYLRGVVERLLRDGQPHHSAECYEIVMREKPEIFTRNSVLFQFRCYSVLEYLFRDEYEFSRPYFAALGTEIGRPLEQLREFVYGNETISLSDISTFIAEIHVHVQSLLSFVNSCNDKYLLINNENMMATEETGVDESVARLVEDLVCEEITETALIRDLPCWVKLPPVNVPWTEWLVYSILNKWGSKVEVAPSHNQFRMSVPLVAPKGKMQAESFADVYKELDCDAGNLNTGIMNQLDHIDDLLMDLLDEELLEDDLWD